MDNKVGVSWSTGKDSALAVLKLQSKPDVLISTLTKDYQRVAMHSTRLQLLEMQSTALDIPLQIVEIPAKCSNQIYENTFRSALMEAQVGKVAFGDLFLEDVRKYREDLFKDTNKTPIFPLWGIPTRELANEMIQLGFEAYLTCIDPRKLPKSFAGRKYDQKLLQDLPETVDPCGENGEFHTFVFNAPNFKFPIRCSVGEIVERDGFVFADVAPEK